MRFSFQIAPAMLRIKPYGEYQVWGIEAKTQNKTKQKWEWDREIPVIWTVVIRLNGVRLQWQSCHPTTHHHIWCWRLPVWCQKYLESRPFPISAFIWRSWFIWSAILPQVCLLHFCSAMTVFNPFPIFLPQDKSITVLTLPPKVDHEISHFYHYFHIALVCR